MDALAITMQPVATPPVHLNVNATLDLQEMEWIVQVLMKSLSCFPLRRNNSPPLSKEKKIKSTSSTQSACEVKHCFKKFQEERNQPV